jgi:oligogalacturonide transporter
MWTKERIVKPINMLAYGIGDLYGGGAFLIIGALYLYFMTNVAGLEPIYAGAVIMVGKMWDAISDPVMGLISDNTRSKYGRRRVYFLVGILPVLISFALLWYPVGIQSEFAKFMYYLLVYLLFNTVFTLVMVPYNTLAAEMASDYTVRSKMTGVRMAFSQFSALLGATIPMLIIKHYGDSSTGYIMMGIVFGVFYALPWIFVYKGTWEREIEQVHHKATGSLAKELKGLLLDSLKTYKNKSLRVHIGMYLNAYVAMDIFNALMVYYLAFYLGNKGLQPVVLGVVLFSQLAALYFVARSCSKRGNGPTYRNHLLIWIVGVIAFYFIQPDSGTVRIVLNAVVIGIGLCGGVMVPYNSLPFVVDADEIISSKRQEGIYAGMMTFLRKATQAVALFMVGIGLQLIGFDSGQEIQSVNTVFGIRLMIMLIPLILLVIGIIYSISYKITPESHKILLAEIERLKGSGDKNSVEESTRNICEEITGVAYDELWGGL